MIQGLRMKFFERKRRTDEAGYAPTVTRRSFLEQIGLGSILAALVGFGYQTIRSLVPNVLYEPSRKVKIGFPSALAEGVTFLPEQRLYVFKEGKSFYAISGTCTHLGCTVKYVKLNQPKLLGDGRKEITSEFHCPCHGSKFYNDGTNYAGPAPGPLHWYKVELAPDDGQLVVDMGTKVEQTFRLTV